MEDTSNNKIEAAGTKILVPGISKEIRIYHDVNLKLYQPDLCADIVNKENPTSDEFRRLNRYIYHPQGQRICCKCKTVFPSNSEYFHIQRYYDNKRFFALECKCKNCSREKRAQYKKKLRENPEKYCKVLVKSLKNRAKSNSYAFNLTGEDLYTQLVSQDFRCFYSGEMLDFTLKAENNLTAHRNMPSVDKIDPKGGYVVGNIVWCLNFINIMKSNLSMSDFCETCTKISKLFECKCDE